MANFNLKKIYICIYREKKGAFLKDLPKNFLKATEHVGIFALEGRSLKRPGFKIFIFL